MLERVRKVIRMQKENKRIDNEFIFASDDETTNNTASFHDTRLGSLSRLAASQPLLEETQEEEFSEGKSSFVKIVDKSRRAFSISTDSTKAFEMSLR